MIRNDRYGEMAQWDTFNSYVSIGGKVVPVFFFQIILSCLGLGMRGMQY